MTYYFWRITYRMVTYFVLIIGTLLYPFLRGWAYRDLLWHRLWPKPLTGQPTLWFHAVSLGEAVILNTVLARFSKEEIESFLITSSTLTGIETLEKKHWPSECRFLPFDHPISLGRMFSGWKVPDLMVVETEIWPDLFLFVTSHMSRILMFNARFGERTLKRRNNPLLARSIRLVNRFLVRSEAEASNLDLFEIPKQRVSIMGNIKFDYTNPILKQDAFRSWLQKGPVIIFSSISNDEVSVLVPELLRLSKMLPTYRFLWVPRHFDQIQNHLDALQSLEPQLRVGGGDYETRCIVLNSVGELAGTYPFSQVSITGGSFNQRGGQNFLESLSAGVPVVMGPSMRNFQVELDMAKNEQAVIQIERAQDLAGTVFDLLEDTERMAEMKEKARKLIQQNQGATEKTVQEIRLFLS